ncbi:MAG TPA: SLBB domain-containing protein [Gemmatimonadaceae bacterium]|nr:SLBB domain-containing protein [Gemmatimonadaceae bacterium]
MGEPSAARRNLETMAEHAESAAIATSDAANRARLMSEAQALRLRLAEGDFQVGDRIVLRIAGDSTLPDTLPVRAGLVLPLGQYGDVSLRGVLRQDLMQHLTTALGRYIREPQVQALTLVRVAVIGAVARPGYYHVAGDALMTDLVMLAGGPSSEGDLARISVRRNAGELIGDEAVRTAVASGRTVTDLGLRAGDEIVVGERKRRSVSSMLSVLSAISAVAIGLVAIGGS